MIGTFGMPQLQKLKYLLDGAEYKEDAKITITTAERNGETVPVGIHFENKDSDFKNDYRFMSQEIISEKMKTVKFRGVKWDVEVEPSVAAVQRFNFQAGANNEHPTFLAKTDNGATVSTGTGSICCKFFGMCRLFEGTESIVNILILLGQRLKLSISIVKI
jgi:hypothetical protein